MGNIIAVLSGGAIGSLLRHLIFLLVQRPGGSGFPYGTLAANLPVIDLARRLQS